MKYAKSLDAWFEELDDFTQVTKRNTKCMDSTKQANLLLIWIQTNLPNPNQSKTGDQSYGDWYFLL